MLDPEDPVEEAGKGSALKRWVYTLNNYASVEDTAFFNDIAEYHVFGVEVAPTTGTPHLQGFVCLKNRMRMAAIKKLNPVAKRLYLFGAKGTNMQASRYCKGLKKGVQDPNAVFHEYGELPLDRAEKCGAATKERYEAAWELAKAGKVADVDKDLLIKHYRTFKTISVDHKPQVDRLNGLAGVWIHGRSGSGKSFKARADYPNYYTKNANKWWCGYEGEDNVIIDDLDEKHACLSSHLKIWLDIYPFTAETKGGSVYIRPKKVIITSQYSIEDIWFDEPTREALNRRCEVIAAPDGGFPRLPPPPIITALSDVDEVQEDDEESILRDLAEFENAADSPSGVRASMLTPARVPDSQDPLFSFEELEESVHPTPTLRTDSPRRTPLSHPLLKRSRAIVVHDLLSD